MTRTLIMLALMALVNMPALGQGAATQSPPSSPSSPPAASPSPEEANSPQVWLNHSNTTVVQDDEGEEEHTWAFSASGFMYVVPDDHDYAAATFTADRDWLHLEGRYNYEDIDTGSVFAGVNFSFGEELMLDVTPMLGGVFGNTDGIAPGYELTLSWRRFELYTEGEYLFDLDDSSENYFYSWSEFSYYPADWLRFGLVVQRTKAYETDLDIQRGFLVGFSYKNVDFTSYVLNLGWDDPTLIFSITLNF